MAWRGSTVKGRQSKAGLSAAPLTAAEGATKLAANQELVAGVTPPRGMVKAAYRQTEGNPLFVTEVVRLLVQEGQFSIGQPGGAPTEPANRARAMALLNEALAIFREIGMLPLMERVLSRREILTA